MNTTMKRIITLLLCLVLATSCLPVSAFATESGETAATVATEPAVVAVSGIALDQTALEVGVGAEPVTLTATVLPEDATDKTVTWTSSEPGVVSVENGVLTFGYMGTATVTATAGEFSASCAVTVGEGNVEAYDLEKVVDAAVVFSDLHTSKSDYKQDELTNFFTMMKNTGLPVSSVTSGGDAFSVNEDTSSGNGPYTGLTATLNKSIRNALGNQTIPINYVWSDHDRYAVKEDGATLLDKTSRLVYGAGNDGVYGTFDDGNYYVYALSMGDLCSYDRYKAGFNYTASNNSGRVAAGFTATVDEAIDNFEDDAAMLLKDRPLLIVSHQPLFDRRNDNAHAEAWFDAINEVAREMDVAFFFGHNHKYDNASDYYYAKGSTMPVATADKWGFDYDVGQGYLPSMDLSSESKTLNFTHMCAGYLEPTSTGSYDKTGTRLGTAMAVVIYEDSIQYTTYNASGVYTGNYALDVNVERDHAVQAPTETGITVTPPDKTVYSLNEPLDTTGMTVTLHYSDDTGTTLEVGFAISAVDTSTPGTKTVTVTYNGFTASFDITVEEETVVPEGYALARIEVVNQGNTKYFLNDTLDTDSLSVVAVYTKENAADVRKVLTLQTAENEDGYTISGVDMSKAGKQYVTVTYGECVGSFAIEVYETHFENETGTVAVDFTNYGITSVVITEKTKEVEGYSAYVTYDITPTGYTQGDEATVTVVLDMDLFDASRPVKVLDQGNVIATPNIVDGKISFTTNHFTEYDVAQVDASDAQVDPSKWIEVIPATGGTTTYAYKQATSITKNGNYVIVANSYPVALQGTTSMGTQSVTISGNNGNQTMTSQNVLLTEWTFNQNSNGTTAVSMSIYNGSRYLRYSGNSFNLNANTATLSVSDQGNNFRIYSSNRYFYYNGSQWTRSSSGSAQNVRLFVRDAANDVTVGGTGATYGQVVGATNYQVALGTNEAAALQAVKNGMTVYYTTDKSSTTGIFFDDDGEGMSWEMASNYDPNTAGKYTVTIKYNNVVLGTATVEVVARKAQSVTLDKYEGTVERDSGADVETGAYLSVTWDDNTTEQIPVTVGMLTGNVNVKKNGTYTGLSFSYVGKDFENFTLKVVNKTGVDDFPLYPNPGSIDLKKNATGVDFQNTGIARVELSTSGLPIEKGIDVIVMLDLSSSMERCIAHDSKSCTVRDCKTRLEELKDAMQTFEDTLKDSRNAENIRVAVADFNGMYTNSSSPYYADDNDETADDAGLNNTEKDKVHTGDNTLTAGAFVSAKDLDVSTFTYTASSGTNYDYAFDAIYQLGHAIKKQNAENNEERELYVLFMSDGAPNQYNFYRSVGGNNPNEGSENWNYWLRGTATNETHLRTLMNCDNHLYYYDWETGNQHRMANAVKGSPDTDYKVIRKATTGLADVLDTTDQTNIYTLPGLGAKMYAIAFDIANDGAITAESVNHVLHNIPSSPEMFYEASEEGALQTAFTKIAGEIAYAAENARFVDQMGDSFNLQMNPVIRTNETGSDGTTKTTTDITITTRPVYTKEQVGTTVNGYTVKQDDIGKPYGNGTTVETVKFAVDGNGKITATTTAGGYTLPDGTPVTANSTNILVDGVIYGKNFFYNNNNAAVQVTLSNGSTYALPGETFYWNIGIINETQYTIAYTVYLEGAMDGIPAPGSYATNNFAILYYTNHVGNEVYKSIASPSVAWKGANVSYAFYLVDNNGNPVHADGTTAQNFLQAHKITQPVVYQSVELNADTGATLKAAALAVLPAGYELYAKDAVYHVEVGSGDGQGANISHWKITNDSGKTTYVVGYGGVNDYSNEQYVSDTSYDYTHTTVYFAVKWVIGAVQDTVVIDYGLPVDINVMVNDMFGNAGTLHAVGKRENKPSGHGSPLATGFSTESVDGEFGTAVIKDGKIRYTLNNMLMNGAEKLAYAVDYSGEENEGFYYGDLTIIPATTVYYEDEYVTLTTFTRPDANTAYTQKSGWPTNSVAASGTQAEDRPGSFNLGTIDANNIYGYDQAYDQMSTHSMGNSAMIHVDATQYGTAEFSFWGTGFDVISATSNKTGTLVVQVRDVKGELVTLNGKPLSNAVDTYYGYTYGLYNVTYQKVDGLWTLVSVGDPAPDAVAQTKKEITSGVPNQDGTVTGYHYTWKPVTDESAALYQVPVIQYSGLTYGKYTVKISALYYPTFDATADPGYDLYLDAIRIYDPAGEGDKLVTDKDGNGEYDANDDTSISDIYAQDGEAWPSYHELRDLIISAKTFDNLGAEDEVKGIVFIDGDATLGEDATVTGNAITDYTNFGPNNELYLASGQAVAFNMKLGTANDHPGYVPVVRIGMKTVGGKAAVAELWNATENADGTANRYNAISETLQTATDMYYDITVLNGKTVVIKNSGDKGSILSITNIKLTYKPTVTSTAGINEPATVSEIVEQAPMMFSISRSAANVALMSLEPAIEELPEVTEPTEPETEPTEPETEPTEPAKPDNSQLKSAVDAAKELKEKDYTKESFEAVKAARKAAEKVLKDKKATQAEIDAALEALNEAVEELETKASATKPGKEEKTGKEEKPGNAKKPEKDENPAQDKTPARPGADEAINKIKKAVAWLLDWLN